MVLQLMHFLGTQMMVMTVLWSLARPVCRHREEFPCCRDPTWYLFYWLLLKNKVKRNMSNLID